MEIPTPTRPCWVEISTRSLESNYQFLHRTSSWLTRNLLTGEAELLAIVKADAYGHALALCAPAAVRAGAQWLGVTSVEEGVAARAACPEARILVMGGIFPGQARAVVEDRLAAVAWESAQLDELEKAGQAAGVPPGTISVHLEIDTGMSRQGTSPGSLEDLPRRFNRSSPLRLQAVMTHLYASDENDGVASTSQLENLEQAVTRIVSGGPDPAPQWLSVGASAALLGNDATAIIALANRSGLKVMFRPGLVLYGLIPEYQPGFEHEPPVLAEARQSLAPVLAWKTRVVSVRHISPGTEIGYNGTFVATEPMRIALIAAGYADGLDRRLGNRFSLLVRGQRAPLVGRISMDQSVLDITEIAGVEAGDEVVILGMQGQETITAFDHAEAAGTIPWEVFTRIGRRVPRIAV